MVTVCCKEWDILPSAYWPQCNIHFLMIFAVLLILRIRSAKWVYAGHMNFWLQGNDKNFNGFVNDTMHLKLVFSHLKIVCCARVAPEQHSLLPEEKVPRGLVCGSGYRLKGLLQES